MSENIGRALGWDEEIDNVNDDFEIFDPGDYPFEVVNIERATFNGSAKMEASPMAKLTLKLTNPADGHTSNVFYNLILNEKLNRLIKEFFVSISLVPEEADAKKLATPWNKVVGACGWLHMEHRKYNGNTYADVKKCLKPSEVIKRGLAQAPVAQPTTTQIYMPSSQAYQTAQMQEPATSQPTQTYSQPVYQQQTIPMPTPTSAPQIPAPGVF